MSVELAIRIVRFVDDYQPGIVEAEFEDAAGVRHSVIDKVPMISLEDLDAKSEYPRAGSIRCDVLSRWRDETGRDLVRVRSHWGIETTAGVFEWIVLEGQVS